LYYENNYNSNTNILQERIQYQHRIFRRRRLYPSYTENKLHIGYVLIKNYTMIWIKGYDRIEVFINKEELDKFILEHNISIIE
jgi:hypothetical protein